MITLVHDHADVQLAKCFNRGRIDLANVKHIAFIVVGVVNPFNRK